MIINGGLYKNKKIYSKIKNITLYVKPTKSKVKESIFSVINSFINDKSCFLDLCCGTGSIGIEALSRGFKKVYFVDISKKHLALVKHNLDRIKCVNHSYSLIQSNLFYLQIPREILFNVIYLDPPYQTTITNRVFQDIKKILNVNSLLIVETGKIILLSIIKDYRLIFTRSYGKSVITIMTPK